MKPAEAIEIVVEQLLAQRRRQIGLAVVEQRRDVVLQRAFAAALVIEENTAGRRAASRCAIENRDRENNRDWRRAEISSGG